MTTIANEIVCAAPVHTFDSEGLRTVKITTMRNAPSDVNFFAELHDEPGVIRRVLGATFDTTNPLKAWEQGEGATILIEGRGSMRFCSHMMGGPKYPVARIVNDKTGRERNVRVTFKVAGDKPKPKEVAMIFNQKEPDTETVQAEIVSDSDAQMTKPVKADYDKFSEYMAACKKFKAWEREHSSESTDIVVA